MKKNLLCLLILITLIGGTSTQAAVGSAFGNLSTAQTNGLGKSNFGFGIGLGDATTFAGSLTYGLSAHTDGRLKLGLIDWKSNTEFTFGADFKWQYWSMGDETKRPFEMAFGGFFEYADYDIFSVFQFGAQVIGSYPVTLSSGGTLTPYGRFNARIESASSDSNLEIGFNFGAKWEVSPSFSFFGEFQIDGNDGLFIGFDLNVM